MVQGNMRGEVMGEWIYTVILFKENLYIQRKSWIGTRTKDAPHKTEPGPTP